MSEPIILGSETPSADVLVYDKGRAFYQGDLLLDDDGTIEDEILDDNGTNVNAIYEYVSEA